MKTCEDCTAVFYYAYSTYEGRDLCDKCYTKRMAKGRCSCGADKAGVGEWGHSRWCVKSERYEEYMNIQRMKELEDMEKNKDAK